MPSYKSNTSEILTKLKAFSLVEVLMTLLIMSLIIVALAPVITKKNNAKVKGGRHCIYIYGQYAA